jgi:hypothetical protein
MNPFYNELLLYHINGKCLYLHFNCFSLSLYTPLVHVCATKSDEYFLKDGIHSQVFIVVTYIQIL